MTFYQDCFLKNVIHRYPKMRFRTQRLCDAHKFIYSYDSKIKQMTINWGRLGASRSRADGEYKTRVDDRLD